MGETIGIWFVCNKLVIPPERLPAALWVYHCSIITAVLSIISAPYNAAIIAHERMSAFAYISVLESLLKLGAIIILIYISTDKLIAYAILLLIVQVRMYLTHLVVWGRNENNASLECGTN